MSLLNISFGTECTYAWLVPTADSEQWNFFLQN